MPPPAAHRANGSPSELSHTGGNTPLSQTSSEPVSPIQPLHESSACTTKDYGPPFGPHVWYGDSQSVERRNRLRQEENRRNAEVGTETELDVSYTSPSDTPPHTRQSALQTAFAEAALEVDAALQCHLALHPEPVQAAFADEDEASGTETSKPSPRDFNFALAESPHELAETPHGLTTPPQLPAADVEWAAVREIIELLKRKPDGREIVWRIAQDITWGHHCLAEFIFEHSEYFSLETNEEQVGTIPQFNEFCVVELKKIWQTQFIAVSPPAGLQRTTPIMGDPRLATDWGQDPPKQINETDEHHRIAAWMKDKYGEDIREEKEGTPRNKFGFPIDRFTDKFCSPTLDFAPCGVHEAWDDDQVQGQDSTNAEEAEEVPAKRWCPTMNRYDVEPKHTSDLPSGVTFEYLSTPLLPDLPVPSQPTSHAPVVKSVAPFEDYSQRTNLAKPWSPRKLMLLDDEPMLEPKRKRCQCGGGR